MHDELYRLCQELYDARAAQLLLYGRALGLSHAEAEDVLQETFLALMKLAERPQKLEHYALRTLRNRALNYRRGLWRRLTRELEARSWFDTTPLDRREEPALRQLACLPDEQREAIVLKIWQGCTFEEMGALTGVSPNTAAARYRYGIQKLRQNLNRQEVYENSQRVGEGASNLEAAPPLGTVAPQHFWPARG